ncbi:Callose synthase [Actinidia chinensis var. chinensis]|uniref:Callose synthase n=1 Tax=Actinidia chinensis var. chinensis TaxID=1590841 RepID=A0A2R6PDI4_ACTCC|nr:Callose synthase [Actinidia chinensis var. chinensis]
MRFIVSRSKPRRSLPRLLLFCAFFTIIGLLLLNLSSIDAPTGFPVQDEIRSESVEPVVSVTENRSSPSPRRPPVQSSCATVEEMGEEAVSEEATWKESHRVRRIIRDHFEFYGAPRVRELPPEQFCKQGFVLGKASEAGFGNEMYKILTAAGLSVMLNRSLIIGQTRGKFPFESYLSYTKLAFTLKEVKHLWRLNDCIGKYGRHLIVRTDDFEKPTETNVLCSNWKKWKQPIIWFQGTTDAVAAQFFLKNIHPPMRSAASALFGKTELLRSRPNIFGELMREIISPSRNVKDAVDWVLNGGPDPHLVLHMRMMMNRSPRAVMAATNCVKKALLRNCPQLPKSRVVLVSDTPSVINDITPKLQEFAEVLRFDYNLFKGNISSKRTARMKQLGFRVKDWGPAPRWVAFVDFFLASRAKHAVVSGAHRRVGTTYAQLIAALAEAQHRDENHALNFSFFSSFQSNLLSVGLQKQIGWGHVWNRFAGPLSCRHQQHQCALTPLLPPGWWDGILQSPIPRDINRLEMYGVKLDVFGTVDGNHLRSFCKSRKYAVKTIPVSRKCGGLTCA